MKEETNRKKAIELFLSGMNVTKVCKQLNKSRKWFYKWKNRYDKDSMGEWYKDESRAPKHCPGKKRTHLLEQQILAFRKQLELSKYAQKGAISIQYEFRRQKKKVPEVWTINRVLKSNGLVKKKRKNIVQKIFPILGENISVYTRWILWVPDTLKIMGEYIV